MGYKIALDRYLDKLAARSPTPGGGSAAALVGAVGMSLVSMVARYTAKEADKGTLCAKLSKISGFTERARRRLKRLMIEDEKAYLQLSRRLKRRGAKDIRGLFYKNAAEVPLEVCATLQEGLKRCEELSVYCKASLASDLAEAVLLLEAAFLSAKFNVDINLGGIKDVAYTRRVRRFLTKQRISVLRRKRKVLNRIGKRTG